MLNITGHTNHIVIVNGLVQTTTAAQFIESIADKFGKNFILGKNKRQHSAAFFIDQDNRFLTTFRILYHTNVCEFAKPQLAVAQQYLLD